VCPRRDYVNYEEDLDSNAGSKVPGVVFSCTAHILIPRTSFAVYTFIKAIA
jgi:hypothetical protein